MLADQQETAARNFDAKMTRNASWLTGQRQTIGNLSNMCLR